MGLRQKTLCRILKEDNWGGEGSPHKSTREDLAAKRTQERSGRREFMGLPVKKKRFCDVPKKSKGNEGERQRRKRKGGGAFSSFPRKKEKKNWRFAPSTNKKGKEKKDRGIARREKSRLSLILLRKLRPREREEGKFMQRKEKKKGGASKVRAYREKKKKRAGKRGASIGGRKTGRKKGSLPPLPPRNKSDLAESTPKGGKGGGKKEVGGGDFSNRKGGREGGKGKGDFSISP